jgi:hypothetical protein
VPAPGPGSLAAIIRRLLLTTLVTVAAFVTASPTSATARAVPVTPDPCAGAPATVTAQQAAFGTLSWLGSGWSTADGFVPVPLPDRRTAWLMSDTLLAPTPASPDPPTLVRNSIVVQRGLCFTPVLGGTPDARTDLVPSDSGRACWQSAGVARGARLVVFCTDVEDATGPPGFGFAVTGTSLASFDTPALTFVGRAPLPFVEPAGIRWGTGAVRRGDWVYVYGVGTGAQYVARARFDRIISGPWRFWTGTAWGERADLAPMTFRGATPAMPAFVTPSPVGYVAVAFPSPLPDPAIAGWTSSSPQGPWQPRGTLATAATAPGQFAYDPRAVDLGRAGWAIVYSVNDPAAATAGPAMYGGRFVTAPRRLTSGFAPRTRPR